MATKKIHHHIVGRLGNQMFQFSFSYLLSQKFGLEATYSFEKKYGNLLHIFDIPIIEEDFCPTKYQIFGQKIYNHFLALFFKKRNFDLHEYERRMLYFLAHFGIFHLENGYFSIRKIIRKNNYVFGYFESSKYYTEYKNELMNLFTPTIPLSFCNKDLSHLIINCESVCVSVRRGDFLSKKYKNSFYVCDIEYFKKAFKIISTKISNPTFFIFSDDIGWCKKKLSFFENCIFEPEDTCLTDKIWLMTSCKHYIISNSTFSWWMQFLSKSINKIVVSPKSWRKDSIINDLNEDWWITI